MDSSKAHLITLWCAVLSKSDRGISRLLPKDVTFAHFRVLSELALPDMEGTNAMRLARALFMKPDDIVATITALSLKGLIQTPSSDNPATTEPDSQRAGMAQAPLRLTDQGAALAARLMAQVSEYLEGCCMKLQQKDRELLATMLSNALSVPGSIYAGRNAVSSSDVLTFPTLRITAFAMMRQAIVAAIKSSLSISFTDFRFLLELYPKKRGANKMLRAKDMVRYLGTGRSYVTTASLRLEEAGYIARIPYADDARGILFKLTAQGSAAVQDVGDDIFAVFASLSGEHATDRRFTHALKLLLEGQEIMNARAGGAHAAD